MARRPKPPPPQRLTRQARLRLNRVLAAAGDFSRNLGLLFVAAPLVDPLINPSHDVSASRVALSMLIGLALVSFSLILAWIQKD